MLSRKKATVDHGRVMEDGKQRGQGRPGQAGGDPLSQGEPWRLEGREMLALVSPRTPAAQQLPCPLQSWLVILVVTATTKPESAQRVGTEVTEVPDGCWQGKRTDPTPVYQKGCPWLFLERCSEKLGSCAEMQSRTGPLSALVGRGWGEASQFGGHSQCPRATCPFALGARSAVLSVDGG